MHLEPDALVTAEVCVIGGGPVGLTAAVALAEAGVSTVLVAPPSRPDNRTTALLAGSVALLGNLGVWRHCREQAAALRAIRLIDDRGGLLHAPEVLFDAGEIGLDAFGHNIENVALLAGLRARLAELPNVRWVQEPASSIALTGDEATVTLRGGCRVAARLLVGADGRSSLCRQQAGIAADEWSYPQSALTCNVRHRRQHDNISTEFHTPYGPFTLVPLPGDRSSLVWVTEPAEGARLAALEDDTLALEIERRSHSILGKIVVEPGRGVFPLTGLTARSFAADRTVLIGEAAHVMPPIGAQGLNLGIRDALDLAKCLAESNGDGLDLGGTTVLSRYATMRRADANGRTVAVDLLNRSLLTDFLPIQALRSLGLVMLEKVGPLRRALMRAGIGPHPEEPASEHGERS